MKKLFISLVAASMLLFAGCKSDSDSADSKQPGGTSDQVTQKAEFTLKEFSYPSAATPNRSIRSYALLNQTGGNSILRDGRRLEVTLLDVDKQKIACGSQEENCTNGVRSFTAKDLIEETFTLLVGIIYPEYIEMEIYDANNERIYKTEKAIALNNDKKDVLNKQFHFYPNQTVTMATNKLKKDISFSLALSEVSNEVVAYATDGITGVFTCAKPNSQEAYQDFPITMELNHDNTNKKLNTAKAHDLNDLYVDSPCELTVTGKRNQDVIFEGKVKFGVEQDKEQTVKNVLYLDTIAQTMVTFLSPEEGGKMDIVVNNEELHSSIRAYFNRDVPLKYTLGIKNSNGSFDKTITLKQEDNGNKLTGEIDYPVDEQVEVTFSVYKDNETTFWLANSQSAKFTTGDKTISPFTLKLNKKVNISETKTNGNVTLRVIDSVTKKPIQGATVFFTTNSSSTDITEKTDELGMVRRTGLGKALVSGVYTVKISKDYYFVEDVSFELKENGTVNQIVELASLGNFSQSSILQSSQEGIKINDWAGTSKQHWQRCYQNSDGSSIVTMLSQCGDKGPTVVLLQLDNGKRVGGYASCSWEPNRTSDYFCNGNSFLFSLTNSNKHKHYRYNNYLHNSSTRIAWGGGHDLYVDSGLRGGTNLGHDYECRVGSYNTSECRNDFTGASSFAVTNMEVFYKVSAPN